MSRFPLIAATVLAVASTAVIATAHDGSPDRADMSDRPDRAAHMLERFDTDGDGAITRAEVDAAEAARFAAADADGNGQLNAAELFAAHEMRRMERQQARMARIIERFDTDGDGGLNAEELAAMRPGQDRLFDVIDADDDGTITQAELDEMDQMRGGWGRRHGHSMRDGGHGPRGGERGPWWGRNGH